MAQAAPTLYMTIGYPGSGKSYFSKKLAKKLHLVRLNSGISGTGIREFMYKNKLEGWPENNSIVYGALRYAAFEVLNAGHSVIFDATNSSADARAKLFELADQCKANAVIIWLKVPAETARSRADLRDSIAETATVPRDHFDRLVEQFEAPKQYEKYITIDGNLSFEEQFKSFGTQLPKESDNRT